MSITHRFRQPEYTGKNRCTPCTVVNVVLAGAASVIIGLFSIGFGVAVFALAVTTIYFRGYFVPGTPTFTKRYFPAWVLEWFGKKSKNPVTSEEIDIDPEQLLLNGRIVEPCEEGFDLCLTNEFRKGWRERVRSARQSEINEQALVKILGTSTRGEGIAISRRGDGFIAQIRNDVIGQWSSKAAVTGDVATAHELEERQINWEELTPLEKIHVLAAIRIFIDRCPECDGIVQVEEERVESCCQSQDVIVSVCQNCDARLLEIEWKDEFEHSTHSQSTEFSEANTS